MTPRQKFFFLLCLFASAVAVFRLWSIRSREAAAPAALVAREPAVFFRNRLDSLLAPERPVVARAGSLVLVATGAENEEPVLRVLGPDGKALSRRPVPGLGAAVQACVSDGAAFLFSEEAFVPIDPDGAPGAAARLVDSPAGLKTFRIDKNVLALVSVDPGKTVTFRAYRLDGSPVREGASFAAPGAPAARAGLARLENGNYLVVWIDGGRMMSAEVSVIGEIKRAPGVLCAPDAGSEIRALSAASGGVRARVAWEESSAAGGVFETEVGADGSAGAVSRLGPAGSGAPRLLGVSGEVVWTGGKNAEFLFAGGGGREPVSYRAPGPIEAFDAASDGSAFAVTVREKDTHGLYAGFSVPPAGQSG
ncbi:MAG TPA: hypothetical protein VL404_02715 [Candidatus Eisenbacteria bacterium]|nr:hypothetical protein [Candidatus Eisenbacteria bacterium]